MFRMLPLSPIDGRKSFNGKANVAIEGQTVYLKSYDTFVCEFNTDSKIFKRLWSGYSATTMRHINSFMNYLGFNVGGKKWWNSIENKKEYYEEEIL